MVPDIDRATRDPRALEDLIDAVELYGLYVTSLTGNIDLTTDAGISAARALVNQRNQESRNTSRRVIDGQRHARMKGRNHGGKAQPFGWRKDRVRINKREADHIRREVPRILAGVRPLTLAREWIDRGIPTSGGTRWRATTIKNIFTNPRMAGYVVYRGEILHDADGNKVRGEWEPILTDEEWEAVTAKWKPSRPVPSRLGAIGKGLRDALPAVPVRAVRELQFPDGRVTQDRQARRGDSVLPVPAQRRGWVREPIASGRPGGRVHQGSRDRGAAENTVL